MRIHLLILPVLFYFNNGVASNPLQAPFSTMGNQIVNSQGKTIRLMGVNWFGFETATLVPHGLWTRNYKEVMNQIKSLGFNSIRLPYCDQMLDASSKPNSIDYNKNPDLVNLSPVAIMDKIVSYADQIGLYILLDHHRNAAGDGPNDDGLWYSAAYPESKVIQNWQMLAQRYKNNYSVIGADLHNEPHESAVWNNSSAANNWRQSAQKMGNAVLSSNPNLLIVVEGIEAYNDNYYWWGGNLMGVKDFPVTLNIQNKVVYSPHDYPNSVYSQPWFSDPSFPNNLTTIFTNYWGYIYQNNIAPIILGEFGSRLQDSKDVAWFQKISVYLNNEVSKTRVCTPISTNNNQGMSWTYWSFNPESSDTGGILQDDWITVDQAKINALKAIMVVK